LDRYLYNFNRLRKECNKLVSMIAAISYFKH